MTLAELPCKNCRVIWVNSSPGETDNTGTSFIMAKNYVLVEKI